LTGITNQEFVERLAFEVQLTKVVSILVVLVLFGFSLKNSIAITLDGVAVTAVCIDQPSVRKRRSRGLVSIRQSEFRFADQQGQQKTASIWVNFTRPKPGADVEILYSKSNPKLIFYNSLLSVWIGPVLLMGLLLVPSIRLIMKRGSSEA